MYNPVGMRHLFTLDICGLDLIHNFDDELNNNWVEVAQVNHS
jgi:hypothetical protein